MEKKKLVVVFDDEMHGILLDQLFQDLEEADCRKVYAFDKNTKIIIEVPKEIPDPDFTGKLTDYWHYVIYETLCPCCISEREVIPDIHAVMTLKEFEATQK